MHTFLKVIKITSQGHLIMIIYSNRPHSPIGKKTKTKEQFNNESIKDQHWEFLFTNVILWYRAIQLLTVPIH